ncbi:MAG: serine hydrolase [Syntrophobacteraceae bacterium]
MPFMKLARLVAVLCCFMIFSVSSPFAAFSEEAAVRPSPEKMAEILSSFEKYAEKSMRQWEIPGMAIAIVQDDKIVYKKGFGVKKAGGSEPVTENTVFQIGSTSKAFTGALMAILADEKKAGWNDRVIDHLPWFRLYDPWVTTEFTVTDLLAHRSGLPGYAGDGQAALGFTREQILKSVRFIKPVSSFRAEYAYQNSLYVVAAEIPAKYWGMGFEEAVREKIFKPLGMSASSATAKEFSEAADVTSLHNRVKDKVTPCAVDKMGFNCYTVGPAGGINSNVVDMSKWLMLHLNMGTFSGKQVISKESMNHLLTPKTFMGGDPESDFMFYCQGWIFRNSSPYPLYWHNGDTTYNHTMAAFVPGAHLGIVVLTNLGGLNQLPEMLAGTFYDMYVGKPFRDLSILAKEAADKARPQPPKAPENPGPSLAFSSYVGKYRNDIYGILAIEEKEGKLSSFLAQQPDDRFDLKHWDRDTFRGVDKETGEGAFLTFQFDSGGKAKNVTIAELNRDGCGVFEKIGQ